MLGECTARASAGQPLGGPAERRSAAAALSARGARRAVAPRRGRGRPPRPGCRRSAPSAGAAARSSRSPASVQPRSSWRFAIARWTCGSPGRDRRAAAGRPRAPRRGGPRRDGRSTAVSIRSRARRRRRPPSSSSRGLGEQGLGIGRRALDRRRRRRRQVDRGPVAALGISRRRAIAAVACRPSSGCVPSSAMRPHGRCGPSAVGAGSRRAPSTRPSAVGDGSDSAPGVGLDVTRIAGGRIGRGSRGGASSERRAAWARPSESPRVASPRAAAPRSRLALARRQQVGDVRGGGREAFARASRRRRLELGGPTGGLGGLGGAARDVQHEREALEVRGGAGAHAALRRERWRGRAAPPRRRGRAGARDRTPRRPRASGRAGAGPCPGSRAGSARSGTSRAASPYASRASSSSPASAARCPRRRAALYCSKRVSLTRASLPRQRGRAATARGTGATSAWCTAAPCGRA